jgi:hypothetical protein
VRYDDDEPTIEPVAGRRRFDESEPHTGPEPEAAPDPEAWPDPESPTVHIPERSDSGSPAVALVIIAAIVVVAGLAWWVLRRPSPPPAPEPAAAAESASAVAETPTATKVPVTPSFVLPTLAESDAVLRELAKRISSHPRLLAWFANDDLVRRFVATVANLAEGASPAPHVRFLTPAEPFRARGDGANGAAATVHPASYRRYDLATEAFVSLDTAGTAKLYRELSPLFDEAYHELGYPGRSFDEATSQAIERLLAVEVPAEPPALVARGANGWAYAESWLEEESSAAKHLLRLGPENARRAQAKLRELAAALDLSPAG